jgi:FtsZ-binding cell division protein ZapB
MQSEIEVTQVDRDAWERLDTRMFHHNMSGPEVMARYRIATEQQSADTIASLRAEIERLKAEPIDTTEAAQPLVVAMKREGWWRVEIMRTDNGGWQAEYEPHDDFPAINEGEAK